jgi:predicted CXXCH cytochrome family protein
MNKRQDRIFASGANLFQVRAMVVLMGTAGLLLLLLALFRAVGSAAAQDGGTPQPTAPASSTTPTSPASPPAPTGDDSYCMLCHALPDQHLTLPDGNVLNITIDPAGLAASVHGTSNPQGALGCTDCHGAMTYPHDQPLPPDARTFTLEMFPVCTTCHVEQATGQADSVHEEGLAEGNFRAATCIDCHGSHEVQPPNVPRTRIPETCGMCHTIAFSEYKNSVHGQALFAGDPNVPTCIDCHGVHNIQHPTTALFRNRSPELCAGCHANKTLMKQYGISTNVFDSYVTDFHGTTVQLFEQEDPNVPTNKAVCFDCHGVHNIAQVNAKNSRVIKENLLATCQQCHPDATSNFPSAWIGHYPPTFSSEPLLYSVKTFYKILIPSVIAGFLLLIGLDIFGRIRRRSQR